LLLLLSGAETLLLLLSPCVFLTLRLPHLAPSSPCFFSFFFQVLVHETLRMLGSLLSHRKFSLVFLDSNGEELSDISTWYVRS
jgi:hypothetical protein